MAAPQNAGIPDSLDLGGGYTLEFTALDATAGTDVTSVLVSLATLTVDNVSSSAVGPPGPQVIPVPPLWVPVPAGTAND